MKITGVHGQSYFETKAYPLDQLEKNKYMSSASAINIRIWFGMLILLVFVTFVITLQAQDTNVRPVSINIKSVDGLQFDVVRFMVKPGAKITITLSNESDMDHNLLITKPGKRMVVVNASLQMAGKGPQMNYIPNIDEVLWSIPVISLGQTKSVSFTAPLQAGVYPYVCTYPGHGFVMYGAMYVSDEESLPDISRDLNIPEARRNEVASERKLSAHTTNHMNASPHPYPLIPPYLYHVFIVGAGPAAIAVNLPGELSYCWDAGTCSLRFAWKGDFLDMSDLWKGHFDASAKILGDIFFRDNTAYPLRSGKNAAVPVVDYKGYRLVERYPEFHYTLDGTDVYEMIRPNNDGTGLIRDFRIPSADRVFWFYANHEDEAVEYEFSAGRFRDKRLELIAGEAKKFTVKMKSYYLAYKKKSDEK